MEGDTKNLFYNRFCSVDLSNATSIVSDTRVLNCLMIVAHIHRTVLCLDFCTQTSCVGLGFRVWCHFPKLFSVLENKEMWKLVRKTSLTNSFESCFRKKLCEIFFHTTRQGTLRCWCLRKSRKKRWMPNKII